MKDQSPLAKSVRGSFYNIAITPFTMVLGVGRSVLLMRLLKPDDFGLVTLALSFMMVLTPFATLGIDKALIQRTKPEPVVFSTHFMMRIGLAGLMLVIGWLISPLLRWFYGDQPQAIDVFLVLLGINLLNATASTPTVILRREMYFGTLALLNLVSSLAMTIIAPLLAYLGFGLWSLVAEPGVSTLTGVVMVWGVVRVWRPSFSFDWSEARQLFRFGRQVVMSNLLGVLQDRFDDFWTGTSLGPVALGYYSRAYEIARYPKRIIATPITNVFFSAYAALQEDNKELSQAFFRSSSFLVRAGLGLALVLMATVPEITLILFGETWLPIVPVFRLMLIYIVLDPFYLNLSYLIIAVGRPDQLTRVRLIQVVLFIGLVIGFAYRWGINGVAMAANLMMLTGTVALLFYSRRFVRFSLRRLLLWPVVAMITAGLVSWLVIYYRLPAILWAALLLKVVVTLGIYGLILYLAERDMFFEYGQPLITPLQRYLKK